MTWIIETVAFVIVAGEVSCYEVCSPVWEFVARYEPLPFIVGLLVAIGAGWARASSQHLVDAKDSGARELRPVAGVSSTTTRSPHVELVAPTDRAGAELGGDRDLDRRHRFYDDDDRPVRLAATDPARRPLRPRLRRRRRRMAACPPRELVIRPADTADPCAGPRCPSALPGSPRCESCPWEVRGLQ